MLITLLPVIAIVILPFLVRIFTGSDALALLSVVAVIGFIFFH